MIATFLYSLMASSSVRREVEICLGFDLNWQQLFFVSTCLTNSSQSSTACGFCLHSFVQFSLCMANQVGEDFGLSLFLSNSLCLYNVDGLKRFRITFHLFIFLDPSLWLWYKTCRVHFILVWMMNSSCRVEVDETGLTVYLANCVSRLFRTEGNELASSSELYPHRKKSSADWSSFTMFCWRVKQMTMLE